LFGEESATIVGLGVAARGGLERLDVGEVARDTIRDPGSEAEKNFFDDPNTGLAALELLRLPQLVNPFGRGDTRLLLNSSFLFLLEDILSVSLKDCMVEYLPSFPSTCEPILSIFSMFWLKR